MDVRKLTRNAGWSRLFWVLAGVWWLGTLIFYLMVATEIPTTSLAELNDHFWEFQTNNVISLENLLQKDSSIKAHEAGFTDEEISAYFEQDGRYRFHEAGLSVIAPNGKEIANLPEQVTKLELVKKIYKHENNLVWKKRKDLLLEYSWAFAAPFALMIFLLTLRYVIEGFSSEDE